MRQIIMLLTLQLVLLDLSAQQYVTIPEFGKVDKSELLMTACSFEKNASAMYLINEGNSLFKINANADGNPFFEQTEYHVRIKIFNKSGFDNANIKIRYPSSNKNISFKNLSAQTYNLDEAGNIIVSKVEKNTIYDKQINKRFADKIIVFPDIKEGSIIEYKFVLEGYSQNVWYFQKNIPVRISRFTLDLPKELIMSVVPHYNLPFTSGTTNGYSDKTNWYAMENLPGLEDEPFMSNAEDYLQQMEARIVGLDLLDGVQRNLRRSWPGIIKQLMEDEDFGRQLSKDIPRTSELDALLKPVTTAYQKMVIIHDYVRKNMQWNNYDNIWALEGVKGAWRDKKGTSGEINLILINLLKDAGLKVKPILVSTRDNRVINTSIAGFDQFNKVLAYVEIGDKVYVLDATEKETPSNLIPFEVMASEGLLIEKISTYEWGWSVLWDENHKRKKDVFINAEIDDKGMLKGNATVAAYDYAKMELVSLAKEGNAKIVEQLKAQADIKIDSFVLTGIASDTLPMVETFEFSTPVSTSNEYHYFSGNFFAGLEKNPFIADERATDIFFGVRQSFSINNHIFLPDGYQMDELPANLKMITPDTSVSFSRMASYADGAVSINYQLEYRDPVYPVGNYPDFKEFYKKMFGLLNEKFVYKKK